MRENKLGPNIALARIAELSAERQRVELGVIPFVRRPLIEKTYSSVPKGLITHIKFWSKQN